MLLIRQSNATTFSISAESDIIDIFVVNCVIKNKGNSDSQILFTRHPNPQNQTDRQDRKKE